MIAEIAAAIAHAAEANARDIEAGAAELRILHALLLPETAPGGHFAGWASVTSTGVSRSMVCVETGNIADNEVRLAADDEHQMSTAISVDAGP